MIACDTSSFIAFVAGASGQDVLAIDGALQANQLVLPPATFSEALSDPRKRGAVRALLFGLRMLDLSPGYWERVADSRAMLIGKGLKARLADALIAQSCIDADVPLITRDKDFRHFAAHCGLKLV